jgi:signal transduction histidine kinase
VTRRIAASILLTVWAILIVGGLGAYFATRAVLVADLDDLLTRRAVSLAFATARGESEESIMARPLSTSQDRYQVRDEARVIRSSGQVPGDRPASPPRKAAFVKLPDGQWLRTVTVKVPVPADGAARARVITVVYSGPAEQVYRVLNRLALTLAACGVVAGAGAAAVAARVARAALRPLHDASAVVGEIDERNLDRRIDAASLPPELRPAAGRLNEMLARLERSFAQRKQFLADASHELRTPVAALVTTIEVALRRRRGAEELQRTLESCLGDARHLKRLVHVLMEHARGEASAAAQAEAAEPFDAAELLAECADIAATLGTVMDVRVERQAAGPLPVVTQPQRLRSVVMNLLSNAVEYNRPGGLVSVAARVQGGTLEITVRDTGRGIAAEHVPHLFEPFYRAAEAGLGRGVRGADPGRAAAGVEETPHLGLGLFLVDSHLKALGGRCSVRSEVGVGTTMQVSVPAGITVDSRTPATVPVGSSGAVGGGAGGPMNIAAPAAFIKGVGVRT